MADLACSQLSTAATVALMWDSQRWCESVKLWGEVRVAGQGGSPPVQTAQQLVEFVPASPPRPAIFHSYHTHGHTLFTPWCPAGACGRAAPLALAL